MRLEPRQQITASADGTPLFLRYQPRRRAGRFTVLLGHAMTIHSALLGTLSDQLADLGCDVWAGDLRGHGQSVSDRAPLAHLDPDSGWTSLVDDMAAFAKRAFDGVPPENCVMFGGVLSCQTMLMLLQRQPDLARHLVMAPPSPRRTGATRLAANFLRLRQLIRPVDRPDPQLQHHIYSFLKAGLPAGSADADVISAFPDVVAAILADPRGFPTPTMGYWLNVVPGLQRVWDEIRPGDLNPDTRVLLVSSPGDPQLSGQRLAEQVRDWFTDQGLRDCTYVDLPGARSNPMVDAQHLPIAAAVMDWLNAAPCALSSQARPKVDIPPARAEAASPYGMALDRIGLSDSVATANLPDLIQLCYSSLEDDARWIELIYRLCLMSERDSQLVEQILEAIQPHWQRAYELREELRKAAMMGVIYRDVIDRLDLAVALVDGDGTLRHANAAFDAALAALIPDTQKPIAVAQRSARLISAQASWPPPNLNDGPIQWQGKLIGVSFVPASLRHKAGQAPGLLPRLIVLRRPTADVPVLDQRAALLALSFGLTGQESQVALHVAEGIDTETVAERLSMSVHTLRSHLKQVFSKMAVNSRTELASQIMASPIGWMTGDPDGPANRLGDDRA